MRTQFIEQEYRRKDWGEESIRTKFNCYSKSGNRFVFDIEESGNLSNSIIKHLINDAEIEITFKTTKTITETHTLG